MEHLPRIQRMSTLLANQIAAGEVVERPASVVKELLENAIDAGATQIQIDLEKSGIDRIRIRDNGCGIIKEDLILALSRHASSKVTHPDDLLGIKSLGFRGEALASIAAVANISLTSKIAHAEHGWSILSQPSQLDPILTSAAHPTGTTVDVQQLFSNVPARRKFLRSNRTELLHIETIVRQIALSCPQIQITLKHHNSILLFAKAVSSSYPLSQRISVICNKIFMDDALVLDVADEKLHLQGYIGQVSSARTQTDMQYFYVNGRIVRDKLMQHAIKMAYQDLIPEGRYPCYVLYLSLPAEEVDVNVHPTKHEVRFYEARHIHDFVAFHLDKNLRFPAVNSQNATIPTEEMQYLFSEAKPSAPPIVQETAASYALSMPSAFIPPKPSKALQKAQETFYRTSMQKDEISPSTSEKSKLNFTWVNLTNPDYLAIEIEQDLIVLSLLRLQQLLAYETLLAVTADQPILTQPLLLPQNIILSAQKSALLETMQNKLNYYGIELMQTGDKRWLIRSLPERLKKLDLSVSIEFYLDLTQDLSHEQFCFEFCKRLLGTSPINRSTQQELITHFLSLPNWQQHPFKAHQFVAWP